MTQGCLGPQNSYFWGVRILRVEKNTCKHKGAFGFLVGGWATYLQIYVPIICLIWRCEALFETMGMTYFLLAIFKNSAKKKHISSVIRISPGNPPIHFPLPSKKSKPVSEKLKRIYPAGIYHIPPYQKENHLPNHLERGHVSFQAGSLSTTQ